jgi:hypothetical protein
VSGKCSAIRETPLNAKGISLAELSLGYIFGEEVFISEGKRNATVRMVTDEAVVRPKKQDFVEAHKGAITEMGRLSTSAQDHRTL